jgi:hypothetical protein
VSEEWSGGMAEQRPTWQVDRCPSWCAVSHSEHDHPDDRVHRSLGTAVPVTARRAHLGPERVEYRVDHVELEVGASRVDGERTTWFYVGAGPGQHIEVSLADAGRLLDQAAVELGGVQASSALDELRSRSR